MLRINPSIALDVELNGNGTGKHGFQPGDPQTGREPTQVTYQWLNMLQEELANLLEGSGVPVNPAKKDQLLDLLKPSVSIQGQVSFFARSAAPTGWLKANGASVSRTTYAALFAAIGTAFGAGDGSTTFALPDLRGEFIRGFDDSRGVDAGRVFGSWQGSQNLSHSHGGVTSTVGDHSHTAWTDAQGNHAHNLNSYRCINNAGSTSGSSGAELSTLGGGGGATTDAQGNHAHNVGIGNAGSHAHTIPLDGGSESRPRNFALLACIKY